MASLVGAITTLGLICAPASAPTFDPDAATSTSPRPYTETFTTLGLLAAPVKKAPPITDKGVASIERPYTITFTSLGLGSRPTFYHTDFTGKTVVSLSEIVVSDTAFVSGSEGQVDFQEIVTYDFASVRATDLANQANNIGVTDLARVSVSEGISLVIAGITVKPVSDTASVSASEVASLFVSIDVSDTASVSATDTALVEVQAEEVFVTDEASVSADDQQLLQVFAGINEVVVSDDAVVVATDTAVKVEVNRIRRITFSITAPLITMKIL